MRTTPLTSIAMNIYSRLWNTLKPDTKLVFGVTLASAIILFPSCNSEKKSDSDALSKKHQIVLDTVKYAKNNSSGSGLDSYLDNLDDDELIQYWEGITFVIEESSRKDIDSIESLAYSLGGEGKYYEAMCAFYVNLDFVRRGYSVEVPETMKADKAAFSSMLVEYSKRENESYKPSDESAKHKHNAYISATRLFLKLKHKIQSESN